MIFLRVFHEECFKYLIKVSKVFVIQFSFVINSARKAKYVIECYTTTNDDQKITTLHYFVLEQISHLQMIKNNSQN
jgi:hypothetical protein